MRPLLAMNCSKLVTASRTRAARLWAVRTALSPLPYLENVSLHGIQESRNVLRIVESLRHGLGGGVNDGPQEALGRAGCGDNAQSTLPWW